MEQDIFLGNSELTISEYLQNKIKSFKQAVLDTNHPLNTIAKKIDQEPSDKIYERLLFGTYKDEKSDKGNKMKLSEYSEKLGCILGNFHNSGRLEVERNNSFSYRYSITVFGYYFHIYFKRDGGNESVAINNNIEITYNYNDIYNKNSIIVEKIKINSIDERDLKEECDKTANSFIFQKLKEFGITNEDYRLYMLMTRIFNGVLYSYKDKMDYLEDFTSEDEHLYNSLYNAGQDDNNILNFKPSTHPTCSFNPNRKDINGYDMLDYWIFSVYQKHFNLKETDDVSNLFNFLSREDEIEDKNLIKWKEGGKKFSTLKFRYDMSRMLSPKYKDKSDTDIINDIAIVLKLIEFYGYEQALKFQNEFLELGKIIYNFLITGLIKDTSSLKDNKIKIFNSLIRNLNKPKGNVSSNFVTYMTDNLRYFNDPEDYFLTNTGLKEIIKYEQQFSKPYPEYILNNSGQLSVYFHIAYEPVINFLNIKIKEIFNTDKLDDILLQIKSIQTNTLKEFIGKNINNDDFNLLLNKQSTQVKVTRYIISENGTVVTIFLEDGSKVKLNGCGKAIDIQSNYSSLNTNITQEGIIISGAMKLYEIEFTNKGIKVSFGKGNFLIQTIAGIEINR